MTTDGIIRHEFVVQTLQWGLERLRRVQLEQLQAKQASITGAGFDWQALYDAVAGRQDGLIGSGGQFRVVIPVDKRLRFADMKNLNGRAGANAAVYNRPTWGVLFGRDDSVRTRLREGISDSLREAIEQQLREAIIYSAS